jgi:predicted nucleic acid-binding protein
MILVDTSIWVDHFRTGDRVLGRLLETGLVLHHPWITGEIALGHLVQRQEILGLLGSLPAAPVAEPGEILVFVERHQLSGRGVGYVDVQLLAAAGLAGATIWTRDKRLAAAATRLGSAVEPRVVEP